MTNQINFHKAETLRIDLGCGKTKKEGFIGIDATPYPGVDYIADLEKDLGFLPDNSVDEYYTSHVLEHIGNFEGLLQEIHRTIKPEGRIEIIVPHFSNPYFYSDFTHRRFFGFYTMDYFDSGEKNTKRKVPFYDLPFEFRVTERKLVFKSSFGRFLNLYRKHIVQRIFNASTYMQEIYENMFSTVIPCSEIRFVLNPVKKEPGITH